MSLKQNDDYEEAKFEALQEQEEELKRIKEKIADMMIADRMAELAH